MQVVPNLEENMVEEFFGKTLFYKKDIRRAKTSYQVCDAALRAIVCARDMLRSLFFWHS
jgi:hypothetical protein